MFLTNMSFVCFEWLVIQHVHMCKNKLLQRILSAEWRCYNICRLHSDVALTKDRLDAATYFSTQWDMIFTMLFVIAKNT